MPFATKNNTITINQEDKVLGINQKLTNQTSFTNCHSRIIIIHKPKSNSNINSRNQFLQQGNSHKPLTKNLHNLELKRNSSS